MAAGLREQALEAIRRLQGALDKGNDLRHDEMHHAIGCVIALRNDVLDARRRNAVPREMLERANALTSLAYGTEFPLAGVHKHRIEQTCKALHDFVDACPDDGPHPDRP